MANYNPPTENLPIFDKDVFSNEDTPLTIGYADKHYLKYPNAQGTENLASIVVNGTSTFNAGITASSSVSFTSLNAPTSSQTLLPFAENSNKIPTTAWVKSVVGVGGSVYSTLYTTNQLITMPSGCRSVDIIMMGRGGLAGATVSSGGINYYGGSGSGGNTLSCSSIPMNEGEQMNMIFTTASISITIEATAFMTVYSGLNGSTGVIGSAVAGALTNTTPGFANSNIGSFYSTFGGAGAGSTVNGTVPPNMALNLGTPKGTSICVAGKYGCAQRLPSDAIGPGYILITYHLGA